uniref:Uncharacterized protein n=1 Tax=Oryza sativa subsp. japonica TaxID=39947 RepID=Q6YVY5_ORYSJ|nr:hypothetical protein [Oryza sativa Japonica Group]BAD31713.1 hypothetical protein [Oryza sativa Japonica Group]
MTSPPETTRPHAREPRTSPTHPPTRGTTPTPGPTRHRAAKATPRGQSCGGEEDVSCRGAHVGGERERGGTRGGRCGDLRGTRSPPPALAARFCEMRCFSGGEATCRCGVGPQSRGGGGAHR